MPAKAAHHITIISRTKTTALKRFSRLNPELSDWLTEKKIDISELSWKHGTPTLALSAGEETELLPTFSESSTADNHLLLSISREEHEIVFEKMRAILDKGSHNIEKDILLYLEQQLSDITSLPVSTQLDGISLPHIHGRVRAGAHIPRFPGDVVENHAQHQEAGMASKRSVFGWFLDQGTTTASMISNEDYYVGLQLFQTKNWHRNHQELLEWYKHKTVLMINPFTYRAALCSIAATTTDDQYSYQFCASPEVIRGISAWSPVTRGRVLVFFAQTHSSVLGPIDMQYQ